MTFDGHAFPARLPPTARRRTRPPPPGAEPRPSPAAATCWCGCASFLAACGFDPDYFAYLEDVDLGWRQWIFGRRIVAEPRAVARHRGGATGEALGVFSRGFLFEKNAFATAYKNFDRGALPER